MTQSASVIVAVARELAQAAKERMPMLRDGEVVQSESFADGVYVRRSVYCGKTFEASYDFGRQDH